MRWTTAILTGTGLVAVAAVVWLALAPSAPTPLEGAPDASPGAAAARVAAPSPDAEGAAAGEPRVALGAPAATRGRSAPTVAGNAGPHVAAARGAPALEHPGALSALVGRVRSAATGEPVRGVDVALAIEGRRSAVRTDDDGRFRVPWPETVVGRLALHHPRFVDVVRDGLTVPAELELELVPSAALTLVLEPRPAAVEDGEVRLWQRQSARRSDWPAHAAVPAALPDGTVAVRFDDLAPGEYAVAGHVDDRFLPLRAGLDLAPGERRVEVARLERGGAVEGVVVRDDGPAVEDAAVELRLLGSGLPPTAERELAQTAHTDADGRFRFERAAPGSYRLAATAPWGATWRTALNVDPGGDRESLEAVVAAPAELLGSVVDHRGHALPGAEVRVVARRARDALAALLAPAAPDARIASATTDAGGRFRFEGLPGDGALVVVAFPPADGDGLVPAYELLGRIDPGTPVPPVALVLSPGRRVAGSVTDASDGRPLEGVALRLAYPSGRLELPWSDTLSDELGRFAFDDAIEGFAVVLATGDGYHGQRSYAHVGPDEPDPELELRLEPTATLDVSVVDEDGFAVSGLPLRAGPALDDGATDDERAEAERYGETRATDGFGRARFERLVRGRIAFELPGRRHALVAVEPPRPHAPEDGDVTLVVRALPRERSATLVGAAVAAESGAPVDRLVVKGAGGAVLRREDERFELTGVVPGALRLHLSAPGRVPVAVPEADVLPGAVVDVGLHRLRPAMRAVVRVEDDDGAPIDGARVRLVPLPEAAGGVGSARRPLRLERTAPGRYETEFAEAAFWELRVLHPAFRNHRATAELVAGEPVAGAPRFDVTVVLRP